MKIKNLTFEVVVAAITILTLLLLLLTRFGCVNIPVKQAWSPEYEKTFKWVIKEMKLDTIDILYKRIDKQRPSVYIVNMETIYEKYKEVSVESFKKYYIQLIEQGETHKEAEKEIEMWLQAPGAFFNPKTNDIYVGTDTLPDCRIGARVAHEIAHFLQTKVYGRIDPDTADIAKHHITNERENRAGLIERSFGKEFCPEEFKSWEFHL